MVAFDKAYKNASIYIQACWPQINTNNYPNGSVDFFRVHFVIVIVLVIQVLLRSNCTFYLRSFCIYLHFYLLKGNRHKPDLKIRFWCVYIP